MLKNSLKTTGKNWKPGRFLSFSQVTAVFSPSKLNEANLFQVLTFNRKQFFVGKKIAAKQSDAVRFSQFFTKLALSIPSADTRSDSFPASRSIKSL
jgi:hypothetical protein